MSYEDYIDGFWEKVRTMNLDTTQIALGLALAHLWRSAGFPSRHSVSNDVLCDLLSVSKQTLVRARKRLVEGGIIAFEDGNARRQPVYMFIIHPQTSMNADNVNIPNVEKPRIRAVKREKPDDGQLSLFPEQDMQPVRRHRKEPEPPSWEVVMDECRRKGMSEDEAQVFYDYYNAQGWVTSSGQRIRNVDSMINRWLINQKKIEDETNRRFIQQPSCADNIREAQQYAIERMRRQILEAADGRGRGVHEEVPDDWGGL